jgi:ketosteroid isomerase-like protein
MSHSGLGPRTRPGNACGSFPTIAGPEETGNTLRSYAEAWQAADLERVLGAYHDDIVLHYMGESPLDGTHSGKEAVFAVLGQASYLASRKLIEVEDVLVGENLGALLAIEDLRQQMRAAAAKRLGCEAAAVRLEEGRAVTPAGEVYLKLTVIDEVLIVSFKEL